MNEDEEGAAPVRAGLDALGAATPPVSFTAGDVLRQGRRRRRQRRGAAVGGTAAALALVVAVPALALRDTGPDRTVVAGSSRAATPTPTPTPTAAPTASPAPGPRVPGLSPAEADRIARACAVSFGGVEPPATSPGNPPSASPTGPAATPGGEPGATPSPTWDPGALPSPTGPPAATPSPTRYPSPEATPRGWDGAPAPAGQVHVYNRVQDAAGDHALVYGPTDYLSCDREGSGWNAGGASSLDTAWLPGPVAVDAMSAAPGGVRHSGPNAPSGPGYVMVEGRVSGQVARLTVAAGADRAEVAAVNGTFLVRFVKSATWPATDVGDLSIVARDRTGRVLPGVSVNSKRACWVDPDGRVVIGDRANSPAPCRPATPWR